MFRGRLLPVPGHDALFRAFSVLSVMGTQGLRQDGESRLLPRPPLSQKASAGTGTTKARKHGASPLCRKPPLPKRRPSETPPPENVLPLLLPAPSPFSGRNPPREGKSPSRPLSQKKFEAFPFCKGQPDGIPPPASALRLPQEALPYKGRVMRADRTFSAFRKGALE